MKLISLNLEGAKHLSLAIPFLEKEKADVVCLQEVFEKDCASISNQLGMEYIFAPMTIKKYNAGAVGEYEIFGVAILSHTELENTNTEAYWSPSENLIEFDNTDIHTKRKTQRHMVLSAEVTLEKELFRVATTHFTWTPNGLPDEYQEQDAKALIAILSRYSQLVFCGDLNIPRKQNALYKKFTEYFTDAIPSSYITSIDTTIHRVRDNPIEVSRLKQFMVDYLFLKECSASDVRLHSGVSDHMAIVATIHSL